MRSKPYEWMAATLWLMLSGCGDDPAIDYFDLAHAEFDAPASHGADTAPNIGCSAVGTALAPGQTTPDHCELAVACGSARYELRCDVTTESDSECTCSRDGAAVSRYRSDDGCRWMTSGALQAPELLLEQACEFKILGE